jgi:hypothetical protein
MKAYHHSDHQPRRLRTLLLDVTELASSGPPDPDSLAALAAGQ